MFAFNGGPGSSSLWLHMGVLGPPACGRLRSESDATGRPITPSTTSSAFSTRSDLVMIDPVGTGISRRCDHKDEEFWGVDPDIDSLSRFIAQYVSDNNR